MVTPGETRRKNNGARRRAAWILLALHGVVFITLLVAFLLRLRYVQAEGVQLDPLVIVLPTVGVIVLIIGWAVLHTQMQRRALIKAVQAAGVKGIIVYAYWSMLNNPAFLARRPRGIPGRGFDVVVIANSDGIHVQALVHRRLTDFGPISWQAVDGVEGARTEIGVGIRSKGGVLTIRTNTTVPPYTDWLEFFPIDETSATAANRVSDARPKVP